MATLPPDIEQAVVDRETRAREDTTRSDDLEARLDELIARAEAGELGLEPWDDPSVVRHAEALRQTGERVRRESGTLRRVAGTGYMIKRPSTAGR